MLLTKMVKVKWNGNNRKWYESKGYVFTKYGDEFKVKVEDLTKGSHVYVDCQCDECGEILKNIVWQNYLKSVKEDLKYYCQKCVKKLYSIKKQRKTKLLNSESFYDWCYKNLSKEQADEIMTRWDYELNGCSPKDVTFSSTGFNKKGYWFKCNIGIHPSELKRISNFTSGYKNFLDCDACNSIGQHILNTYGENGLKDYWDYEKNNELGLNPFVISKNSNKKIYIFCQKKDYHGSYPVTCYEFTVNKFRCPLCTNQHGKVHKYDSLGWLYPQAFDAWSERNKKSPYDYSPMSTQKAWWKCLDGNHKDYKREIGVSNLCEFRCPECVQERTESILQEKTRLYLEFLGYEVLHEERCTLVPTNPKTKYQLPFDNEIKLINGKYLICEVNGIQHYEELPEGNQWLNGTTPKKYLHYQKLKDRYKRFISYINGYEYLEIPYTAFNKQDTYKKLIDDKIKQILDKDSCKQEAI